MLVECQRPGARKALKRGFCHVSWNPHPDRVVVAQVDKAEVCGRLDLSVASRVDLLFIDRKIADKTIAAITQNRLKEADLECFAQIKNAEALRCITSARVAETTWRFSKSQRVRKNACVNSAKATP
ncbi:hypothetical protein C8J37_110106 [Rhizobium sp. PP-WC-1G-195]|nr:hypothetical protein C8J37_110106 [Rhizobium sp. PP-WC-1G-195]